MVKLFTAGNGTALLSAGGASSRIALPAKTSQQGCTLRLFNNGDDVAFVALGDDSVVAETPNSATPVKGLPLPSKLPVGVTLESTMTHIAAITSSGNADIYITMGEGL